MRSSILSHRSADGQRRPWWRRGRRIATAAVTGTMVFAALAADAAPAGDDDGGLPPRPAAMADPEAQRLADEGRATFEAGRYAEAIRAFEASYRIMPAAGLLYNLAQAHRFMGDCPGALSVYRRFLAADPGGKLRQRTEARIADMERCVAERARAEPPEAPDEKRPAPAIAAPAAGSSGLVLRPSPSASADATALVRRPPPAPPPAQASRPADHPPRSRTARRMTGLAFGAAALVLGGASARSAWRAGQAEEDVSAIYDQEGVWGGYAMTRQRTGERDEALAIALATSAVVSAALSTWLLLLE
jgi:hypothetical protein